jgi:hypothetical protein
MARRRGDRHASFAAEDLAARHARAALLRLAPHPPSSDR